MVSLSIYKGWNDIAQCTQGKVDLSSFFHTISSCSSFGRSFRTSQIHQIQLRSLILLIPLLIALLWVNVDGKDAVGAWGFGVHVGCSGGSVLEAHFHVLLHFRDIVDLYLSQVFHKNTFLRTFFQLHSGLSVFAQQVMDFLVVDFYETAANEMGFRSVIVGYCDYLAESTRDDSSWFLSIASHHGMGFTTSSLAIGEDGAVVSIQNVFD